MGYDFADVEALFLGIDVREVRRVHLKVLPESDLRVQVVVFNSDHQHKNRLGARQE